MNDPQDDMTMYPGSAPEAIADQQRQHREQTVDNSLAAGGIGEGAVFDGYVIEKKLGQGGMGTVFLAKQTDLDRLVAIKVLPPHLVEDEQFLSRFELEAKAVAKLSSPYIVQVYRLGSYNGNHYFSMEFIEGKDLAERLADGARPTFDQSIDFVWQAAKGLAAAEVKGLVHRDIKPANLMVTDDMQVKVMDFGLVRNADATVALTMAGTVMGTPQYFSPEQGRGETCDHRTDVYSLGVVLYELVTGTLPFSGDSTSSIIYQHCHTELREPKAIRPDVPEVIQDIILKCMEKKPKDRFQSIAELVEALDAVRAGKAVAGLGRKKKGGGAMFAVLGLVAAGGIGAAVYFGLQQNQANKQPVINGPGTNGTQQTTANQTPTVVTPPKPEPVIEAAKDSPAQDVLDLIEDEKLDQAQVLIDAYVNEPGSDKVLWVKVQQKLDNKRADLTMESATAELAAGNYANAKEHLAEVEKLDAKRPGLQTLQDRVNASLAFQSGIAAVSELLAQGAFGQADEKIKELRGQNLNVGSTLKDQLKELDTTRQKLESKFALGQEALLNNDLDTARSVFLEADNIFENSLSDRCTLALPVVKQLHQAIAQKDVALIRALTNKLEEQIGDAPVVASGNKAARLYELFQDVRAAAQAADFAAAEKSLNATVDFDATSDDMELGRRTIASYKMLAKFQAAVDAKDLALAQTLLENMRQANILPEVLSEAEQATGLMKLEKEQAAQAASARQQRFEDELAVLSAAIAKATSSQAARQEQAKILELQKRYNGDYSIDTAQTQADHHIAKLETEELLAQIDTAVKAKDHDSLDNLILSADLAARFKQFGNFEELVFAHSVASVKNQGDTLNVKAVLRNGFTGYPENDITIVYQLTREKDHLVVASGEIQQ
jgi:predicted Ser/Thr protein kinase